MRRLVVQRTAIGLQAAIYYDDLPDSLTNGEAQRNGRIVANHEIAAGDSRSDSEILDAACRALR